jgi:hypothetical protein
MRVIKRTSIVTKDQTKNCPFNPSAVTFFLYNKNLISHEIEKDPETEVFVFSKVEQYVEQ